MIFTGRYEVFRKKLSGLLVMDLLEYVDKYDNENFEVPHTPGYPVFLEGIRRLEGKLLDGLPKGVEVGDNIKVVGPRVEGLFLVRHSNGEIRSNGVYKLRINDRFKLSEKYI